MFGLHISRFLQHLNACRIKAAIGLACLPLVAQAALFEEKVALPDNDLDGGLLYQIIASEVALQNQDPALAYQTYMSMARKTKDPSYGLNLHRRVPLHKAPMFLCAYV